MLVRRILTVVFTLIAAVVLNLALDISLANTAYADDAWVSSTQGARFTGFVRVEGERSLYVDFIKPAPGRPVIVLLNGLTYRVDSWDSFTRSLRGEGYGILRYDMQGQGDTLLRYAPVTQMIPLQSQVDDLYRLLNALNLLSPVHLVSLSYGGAIAVPFAVQHPERVATSILMAPFVAPLQQQDSWIKLQIQNVRLMFPMNNASFDDLYDYFLHNIIYATYPAAEPVVLENPYKLEAVFRMVQGARKYYAKDYVSYLPAGVTHLVVARQDQYVPADAHEEFWGQMPAATRASRLFIEGSEHKIPEAVPEFAARWVKRIVEGDTTISGGRSFLGDAKTGKIKGL